MIPPLFVLFMWPVVALILFKRKRRSAALAWTLVAGYLLLPTVVNFNLPLLPTVNKETMPSLAALLAILFMVRPTTYAQGPLAPVNKSVEMPGWLPGHKLSAILFLVALFSGVLTVLTNGDRLVYGPITIPALRTYDAFSLTLVSIVNFIPLILARKYLASPEQHRQLLIVLCVAGIAYCLPALYEIRMSPQLNRIFYGFFPHSWKQHVRSDGFRPLVFLEHGLWLGIFLVGSLIATVGLYRIETNRKRLYLLGAGFLFVTIFLAKVLGSFLIAIAILPFILFFGVRLQMLMACAIAILLLVYPSARGAGLVPVEQIVSYAEKISEERSRSLAFRLRNEDILLDKANQRPLFGWGSWGRNRVFNEEGEDISVTDGAWIIEIGSYGWIGYLSKFGLLTMPIILLTLHRRRYGVTMATSTLCLVLAANLTDLIPNATLTPITWLVAGALLGRLEYKPEMAPEAATQTESGIRPPRYSRAPVRNNVREPLTAPAARATLLTRATNEPERAG